MYRQALIDELGSSLVIGKNIDYCLPLSDQCQT